MLVQLYRGISFLNTGALRIGRTIAWISLALMVFVILLQVCFRYVLNNALPWPDEAARFLMLWMTCLIAPLAYRTGGFVSIDMLGRSLGHFPALILNLVILLLSTLVLYAAIKFGWSHTMGFGGNFDSSSLRLPLDWIGFESVKLKLRYMYASLLTGIILMFAVSIELLFRSIIQIFKPDLDLPQPQLDKSTSGGDE